MKVIDILDKAYGRKKSNGEISQHSLNFIDKYELEMNQKLNTVFEAMDIVMKLSKTMQLKVYDFVKSHFENVIDKKETSEFKLIDIRKKTYKQVAKSLHPDSTGGDIESFQFMQEWKENLWDYKGNPREEFKIGNAVYGNGDWTYERVSDDVKKEFSDLSRREQIQIISDRIEKIRGGSKNDNKEECNGFAF